MTGMTEQMMARLAAERASRRERSKALWEMSQEEREAEMWAGRLTWGQLFEWAKRAPHEIPLINGEWAFIAAYMPEVAEASERQTSGSDA
jgi:predicted mannosyl-3-phosphoglycerate phosphatase (HAD superfamily)